MTQGSNRKLLVSQPGSSSISARWLVACAVPYLCGHGDGQSVQPRHLQNRHAQEQRAEAERHCLLAAAAWSEAQAA